MKRLLMALASLGAGTTLACAQSLDDLNIQIHGYATQGFLYTTQNNILTTTSSNGSPAWSEAVVNVTAQPLAKLRIGVQARYFLLGDFGNSITLDWAAADYKQNDKFGVRFGKVKTPSGMFNEIQDIDPSYIWTLLPQGIYPISSRSSILAHYGGVVYGTLDLKKTGKLEYRGWGGEREIGSNDGYWLSFAEEGISLYSGLSGPVSGAALHWRTPLPGLMIGASLAHSDAATTPFNDTYVVPSGPSKGVTITTSGQAEFSKSNSPDLFGKYERNRVMLAAEYQRTAGYLTFLGLSPIPDKYDVRSWYGMGSYKVTGKLTAGLYQSQYFDVASALGPARYQKDWALSGRYDFNQYVYAKAEQHFLDGTAIGYDTEHNPHGLLPDTRLTALKIGVSF
jgi:hypothetical protein